MKATEILMDEHRVIERVLAALEIATRHVATGQDVRPGFFVDAADFIRGFADGCHHLKEEGVLFRTMEDYGVPVTGGPLGVMLHEHELGRGFTREMRDAALRWQAGDDSARDDLVSNALAYVSLLRQHIQKEDNILFRMADQVIPLAEQEQISEGFDQIEHEETGPGIHEKFLELAERLEREAS